MNCDSVSAGFHFWIGKILAETVFVFGVLAVFGIFFAVVAFTYRRKP